MKKLSNTVAELKMRVACKKKRVNHQKCYHKKSYYEKQKGPGASYQSHFKLPDILRSFLSLVMLQFNKTNRFLYYSRKMQFIIYASQFMTS